MVVFPFWRPHSCRVTCPTTPAAFSSLLPPLAPLGLEAVKLLLVPGHSTSRCWFLLIILPTKWVNGTLIQLSPVICCKCIYTRTLIKTVLLPTLQRARCKNLLFSVFYSRPKFWDVLPSTTSPVLPLRLIFTDSLELAKKHKILWEHATLFHAFLWMHFSPNGQGYALIISVTWVLIRDPNTYENTLPCLCFRARVTPHVNHSASCKPLPSVGWITILQGCNRKAHEPNGLHSLLKERRMVTNENLNNRLQECPATILIIRKLFPSTDTHSYFIMKTCVFWTNYTVMVKHTWNNVQDNGPAWSSRL